MYSMNIDMEIWYVDLICVLTNFVLMNRHDHKFRKSISYCHHEHFLIEKNHEIFFVKIELIILFLVIYTYMNSQISFTKKTSRTCWTHKRSLFSVNLFDMIYYSLFISAFMWTYTTFEPIKKWKLINQLID